MNKLTMYIICILCAVISIGGMLITKNSDMVWFMVIPFAIIFAEDLWS